MSQELKKGDPALGRKMKEEQIKQMKKAVAVKARALTIFEELLKLPAFMKWMEDNIVIRDEIDEEKKTITTYVIYKGDMEDGNKVAADSTD